MQMPGIFARRIVVVSGGGSVPSAMSRAAPLQNSAVEATHAPANRKSRRFACIEPSPRSLEIGVLLREADIPCVDPLPASTKISRQQNIEHETVAAFRHSVLIFDRFGSTAAVEARASLVGS